MFSCQGCEASDCALREVANNVGMSFENDDVRTAGVGEGEELGCGGDIGGESEVGVFVGHEAE